MREALGVVTIRFLAVTGNHPVSYPVFLPSIREHNNFVVYTRSGNSSTKKLKYVSESLGNSKQIPNTFRTF